MFRPSRYIAECFAGQRYPTGGVMSHSCFIQGLLIAEKAA